MTEGYCATCNNTGFIDCHCGGDLCVCGEEEIECPECGGGFFDDPEDDDEMTRAERAAAVRKARPWLVMVPMPCPGCGARNEAEANTMCRPSSDATGEVFCCGEFDANGVSVQPTNESIAALDAWIESQMAEEANT